MVPTPSYELLSGRRNLDFCRKSRSFWLCEYVLKRKLLSKGIKHYKLVKSQQMVPTPSCELLSGRRNLLQKKQVVLAEARIVDWNAGNLISYRNTFCEFMDTSTPSCSTCLKNFDIWTSPTEVFRHNNFQNILKHPKRHAFLTKIMIWVIPPTDGSPFCRQSLYLSHFLCDFRGL